MQMDCVDALAAAGQISADVSCQSTPNEASCDPDPDEVTASPRSSGEDDRNVTSDSDRCSGNQGSSPRSLHCEPSVRSNSADSIVPPASPRCLGELDEDKAELSEGESQSEVPASGEQEDENGEVMLVGSLFDDVADDKRPSSSGEGWEDSSWMDYVANADDAKSNCSADPQPENEESEEMIIGSSLTLVEGSSVIVTTPFKSNSQFAVYLEVGTRGVVREIDADGDAAITFEGVDQYQWVFGENFDKLAVTSSGIQDRFCAGIHVRVVESFKSDTEPPSQLIKGQEGDVTQIDEGWAFINFDDVHGEVWVRPENFVHLAVIEEEAASPDDSIASHTAGVRNIGNTCYMSSSLQCLANVPSLRDFFLTGQYRQSLEVNGFVTDNTSGKLALGFERMLRAMWNSDGHPFGVSPESFKGLVGSFCDQFDGYAQQDSMEFVEFLLDGLKEDCNMVKGRKLCVQLPDGAGRPQSEVALEAVNHLLLRSDSEVDNLLTGLFKSRLACPRPECGYESVTFDPFLSVKVPLSDGSRKLDSLITVTAVPSKSSDRGIQKCTVTVPKAGTVEDLINAVVAHIGGMRAERCILTEVFNAKMYNVFKLSDELSDISECDILVVHELEDLLPPGAVAQQSAAAPKPTRKLLVGDIVVARKDFDSNNRQHVTIPKGVAGEVVKIDSDGDAFIKFDDIENSQWVFERNQKFLVAVMRADSEEIRQDPDTRVFYVPSEFVEAFRMEYSSAEICEYWKYGMMHTAPDPQEAETDDDEEPHTLGVFVHFAWTTDDIADRQLFGFPIAFRTRSDVTASDLDEFIQAELSRYFGQDAPIGCRLFRCRSVRNLLKTREFLVGGSNEWSLEDLDCGESLCLLAEWRSEAPQEVLRLLAEAEACGMGDESNQEVQLETCLEWLTAQEQLDEHPCSGCRHSCKAIKRLEFWSAPPVLVMQLKRFEYVGMTRERLSTPVCFPLEGLDLTEACLSSEGTFPKDACIRAGQRVVIDGMQADDAQSLNGKEGTIMHLDTASARFSVSLGEQDSASEKREMIGREYLKMACSVCSSQRSPAPIYDLIAISTHFGSAHFGHYVAYARSSEDGRWRHYDDDDVTEVTEQEVEAQKVGAYLLFYIRRDVRPTAWDLPMPTFTE